MMKLMKARQSPPNLLNDFLQNNDHINKEHLVDTGYVAMKNNEIVGCFILQRVEDGLFWLKQLYITKSAATILPVLLESILVLAKQNYAKEVYVHSHQPMVDILLEALQFHPKQENAFINQLPSSKGTWWAYEVSS